MLACSKPPSSTHRPLNTRPSDRAAWTAWRGKRVDGLDGSTGGAQSTYNSDFSVDGLDFGVDGLDCRVDGLDGVDGLD